MLLYSRGLVLVLGLYLVVSAQASGRRDREHGGGFLPSLPKFTNWRLRNSDQRAEARGSLSDSIADDSSAPSSCSCRPPKKIFALEMPPARPKPQNTAKIQGSPQSGGTSSDSNESYTNSERAFKEIQESHFYPDIYNVPRPRQRPFALDNDTIEDENPMTDDVSVAVSETATRPVLNRGRSQPIKFEVPPLIKSLSRSSEDVFGRRKKRENK